MLQEELQIPTEQSEEEQTTKWPKHNGQNDNIKQKIERH